MSLTEADKTLQNYLIPLIKTAHEVVVGAFAGNEIALQFETEQHVTMQGFEYTTKGTFYTGASYQTLFKPLWIKTVFGIQKSVSATTEYTSTASFIESNYHPYAKAWFEQYVFQLIHIILDHRGNPDISLLEDHKRKFINDINMRTRTGSAKVYVFGILSQSKTLEIEAGVILRQTVREDIEARHKHSGKYSYFADPSAILEITMQLHRGETLILQEKVNRLVTLLRLYNTGSVHFDCFEMTFDSAVDGSQQSGMQANMPNSWKVYALAENEHKRFLHFIHHLPLPEQIYAYQKKPNYLTTAFDRYTESLLEKAHIERRIANAVMAVEALLSSDTVELSFKMQTRTAKLLSFLGFQALEVRRKVSEAYSIRSTFAHGGYLDDAKVERLEKKFGKIDDFAATIINYVRILLIISIVLGLDKKILLPLVDDALIDEGRTGELVEKMKLVMPFIHL